MAQAEAAANFTMRVVREADLPQRLKGNNQQLLVGLLTAAERQTTYWNT